MAGTEDEPTPLRMTVFDGALSARGYRINRFAKSLTSQAGRDAFTADRRGTMAAHGLSTAEMDLVEAQDWQGLLAQGAAVYLLAKIAIVQGGTLMHIGAQMRGQTLEAFMAALKDERLRRQGGA